MQNTFARLKGEGEISVLLFIFPFLHLFSWSTEFDVTLKYWRCDSYEVFKTRPGFFFFQPAVVSVPFWMLLKTSLNVPSYCSYVSVTSWADRLTLLLVSRSVAICLFNTSSKCAAVRPSVRASVSPSFCSILCREGVLISTNACVLPSSSYFNPHGHSLVKCEVQLLLVSLSS